MSNAKPKITLTEAELHIAATVGILRQIQNLQLGRIDAYGCSTDNGWQLHIEGSCGEAAFAKYMDLFWSGNLGHLKADDVSIFQVRTRSKDWYELIVHPKDPDDRIFILVTGTAPSYTIHGWIKGLHAKKKEWWKDPAGGRPAFFVPQESLGSPVSLIKFYTIKKAEQYSEAK